jgi:alpha-D-xyloside xylohydrolase
VPPFRALVLDYPDDPKTSSLSDQYMMGDSVMVAPVTAERSRRNIYLPAGIWYDFWTKEKIEGGVTITVEVPIDRIPLYIKAGSVLPLAKVTLHTEDPESRILTATVWGEEDTRITLYEDDGNWNPELTNTTLVWDTKRKKGKLEREGKPGELRYSVETWENVM